MIYMPHRELLSESLAASQNVDSISDLLEIIGNPVQLSFKYYTFDNRIPSDLWMVLINNHYNGYLHDNPEKLIGYDEYFKRR